MRSPPVCRFFDGTAGSCHNGDSCPFSHQQALSSNYGYSSYASTYQQKNSWTGNYDPNKYKYVAPKKSEDVLAKITRTISNDEKQPQRTPSPKDIQIVVKNHIKSNVPTSGQSVVKNDEDLSSIYSTPSDLSNIDRCAFESASFTLGLIPVMAPSSDLCC